MHVDGYTDRQAAWHTWMHVLHTTVGSGGVTVMLIDIEVAARCDAISCDDKEGGREERGGLDFISRGTLVKKLSNVRRNGGMHTLTYYHYRYHYHYNDYDDYYYKHDSLHLYTYHLHLSRLPATIIKCKLEPQASSSTLLNLEKQTDITQSNTFLIQ